MHSTNWYQRSIYEDGFGIFKYYFFTYDDLIYDIPISIVHTLYDNRLILSGKL